MATQNLAALDASAQGPADPRHRRNLIALTSSQLVTWSVILAWTFIVPRHLGPTSWGVLVTASALAGILGVLLGLGTKNYLVREMVRNPHRIHGLLATAVVFRLLLFVPGLLLLTVCVRFLHFSSTQVVVIYLAAGVIYLSLLAEPFQALFQAVERMEFLAGTTTTDKVTQAAGAIVLVLLGFGVVAISVWWLGATVLVLALNLIWGRRFTGLSLRTDRRQLRSMVRESLPYWTMGLFLTFYVWIDTAMLSVMAPERVVGWYGVSTRLFGTLLFAATILSTAWLPRLVAAHQQGDEQLRATTRAPTEQLIILGLPIALGAAAVAPALIRVLYGDQFAGAVPVMVILAICVLPLYVNIPANQFLIAAGRQGVWTRLMIGASIVNPLLNLVAIPMTQARLGNGAIGAAVSLLITEIGIAGVSLAFTMRGVFDRRSISRIGRALVAAVGMAAIVLGARSLGVAGQVVLGIVSFVALIVVLQVPTQDERKAVRTVLSRALPWR